jgi:ACS family tartrate transporter-like MFS transporter
MEADIRQRTMAKVARRLVPYMIVSFCINFLDRVNIGFAALQMNKDLGLSLQTYGFAAGILFVGYTAFELPSNLILDRVGARIWIARIMVTWGLLSAATAFVSGPYSLYALRGLLGLAEAGFSPGLILYLTRWFPAEERAKAMTLFLLGSPIAVIFGGPLSTFVLSACNGLLGLAGWKWLFIFEGIPAVLLGIFTFVWLSDRPEQAGWLEPEERAWLSNRIAEEMRAKTHKHLTHWGHVFRHGPTLWLALAKMFNLLSFFGITLWLPQIVRAMGTKTNLQTGLVTAIPYVFTAVGSILIARHSDRTGERKYHIAVPAFMGALGFVLASVSKNPVFALGALCIAATGLWTSNTVSWTLVAKVLTGATAASGIALVNMIGNLGGFFGPYLTGWIRSLTTNFNMSLLMLGGFVALSGAIYLGVGLAEARAVPEPYAAGNARD